MHMNKEDIFALLEEAFADTQKGASVVHPFDRSLKLTGTHGVFDSLDTMLFLDMVDEKLQQKIGRELDLMDGDAFARENSPFAGMQSLADYIEELLKRE